ncbi:BLUF domain-containing protein [Fodinicurvata halophila]|uniref:BLUF domain-containing protein n=2 Tax=Fodinicurvata halophila TaxID=1419723 RepID=A0ABV8UG42_9PROT
MLLYVSSTPVLMDEETLVDILETSRRNNARRDITGMLLYVEGNFMQVIEGPKNAILTLKETIANDPRHSGLIEILSTPVGERIFGNWSMGFRRAGWTDLDVNGMTRFLERPEPVADNDPSALRILKEFACSMR